MVLKNYGCVIININLNKLLNVRLTSIFAWKYYILPPISNILEGGILLGGRHKEGRSRGTEHDPTSLR